MTPRLHAGATGAEDPEELQLRLERSILRDSFADFARWGWPLVTSLPYPDEPAQRALAAALQAVADGRIWRLLIAIAPGIGKSTMLALFAAWRRARRADWRSAHAMAASLDANRGSLAVRRLVQRAEFRRLFPAVQLAEDEATIQAWTTTSGGRYYALGLDTALTSKRVLELVVDDPLNALARHSKTERDRVWAWLDGAAKSRLDGDRGPIIIVAQRLHRDDIHARCLASGEHWCILEPAAARDDRGLELRDHAGKLVWRDDRAPDELIAPAMLSREKLAGLSKSVRTVQYQQRPDEDDGGGSIARTAWRFHAPAGANPNAKRPDGCASPSESPTVVTPDRFDALVISVDPTFGGTKTSNDFASAQVWGAVGPARYLLDRWHRRSKQLEQREAVKALRAKYPRAKIIIEIAAGGAGMIEGLEADGVRNVEGVTVGSHTGGKAARLDNVSPAIEQGLVYLPIGMPGLQDFVDELAGMAVHDDDMDACSQALQWFTTTLGDGGQGARSRFEAFSRFGWLARQARRGDPPAPAATPTPAPAIATDQGGSPRARRRVVGLPVETSAEARTATLRTLERRLARTGQLTRGETRLLDRLRQERREQAERRGSGRP